MCLILNNSQSETDNVGDGAGVVQSGCGGSAAAETASEGVGAGEGPGVGTNSPLHVDSISLENSSASPVSSTRSVGVWHSARAEN